MSTVIGRPNAIRTETENGQRYVVVESPIAKERVYSYDDLDLPNESEFLPAEELERAAASFDSVPINIEHPLVPAPGTKAGVTFGSINDSNVLNKAIVGEARDPRMEGDTLVVDAWLEADPMIRRKYPRYERILENIENGDPAPVSPGYDIDEAVDNTEYTDVRADGVQKGLDGDHVALIISGTPRCTVEEGCAIGGDLEELLRIDAVPSAKPTIGSGQTIRVNAEPSDEATTEADEDEQKEGSDKNDEGSASETTEADIDFDEETEKAIKNKAEEHKEQASENDSTYSIPNGAQTLKKVYRRGAGAYSSSHRPDVSRAQWSMARVNAFLYLLRNGQPENENYTTDYDLLPSNHPKARNNSVLPPWMDRANSVRKEARDPTFSGTSEESWDDVSTGLEAFVSALDLYPGGNSDSISSVTDLTPSQRDEIAEHTLLGDPDAESIREVAFFPVVNPSNGKLYKGALNAVRGGRGSSADIGSSQLASARSKAESLLESEFDMEEDRNNASKGDWVEWSDGYGKVVSVSDGSLQVAVYDDNGEETDEMTSVSEEDVDELDGKPDRANAEPESIGRRIGNAIAESLGVSGSADDLDDGAVEEEERSDSDSDSMSNDSPTDDEMIDYLVDDHGIDRENAEKLRGEDCLEGFYGMARANAEFEEESSLDDDDDDDDSDDNEDKGTDGEEEESTEKMPERDGTPEHKGVEHNDDSKTREERDNSVTQEDFDSFKDEILSEVRSAAREEANNTFRNDREEEVRDELKTEIVANSDMLERGMLPDDIEKLESTHSEVMNRANAEAEEAEAEAEQQPTDFGGMMLQNPRMDARPEVDDENEIDESLAPGAAYDRYEERNSE